MRVALLDRQHHGEAEQGGIVGENASDVGAAAHLAVQPLQRAVSRMGQPRCRP